MAVNRDETLGQIIKGKRMQLGISPDDLAKAAGVLRETIDRIETDQFKVLDPAIVVSIADALQLDQRVLLAMNEAGIEDDDIQIIDSDATTMNDEQRRQMTAVLRKSFSEAFQNTESDGPDDIEDEYPEERV